MMEKEEKQKKLAAGWLEEKEGKLLLMLEKKGLQSLVLLEEMKENKERERD